MLLVPVAAPITVMAYGILLGCSSAVATLAGALVWPRLFGTRAVGRIRAVSSALRNCATAAGPLLIAIPDGTNALRALTPLLAVTLAAMLAVVWLPGRKPLVDALGRD